MKRRSVGVGLTALAIGTAIGALVLSRINAPPQVQVVPVTLSRIETGFTADGTVEGVLVNVAPLIGGRIESILVREGDHVLAGQVVATVVDPATPATVQRAVEACWSARAAVVEARSQTVGAQARIDAAIQTARSDVQAAEANLALVRAGHRPPEIAIAWAKLVAARANLTQAERTTARLRRLFAEGAVARTDLESAETDEALAVQETEAAADAYELVRSGPRPEEVALAQRGVEVSHSRLAEAVARRSELKTLRASEQVARSLEREAEATLRVVRDVAREQAIRAPRGGVVAKMYREPGEMGSPGQPILTILDARATYVEAEVADEDVAQVRTGEPVTVTSAAFPGRVFAGRVVRLGDAAELKPDVAVRTRILRVRIELIEGRSLLKVGMEVDVGGRRVSDAPTRVVPADALLLHLNETAVWVLEGGRVRLRKVKVGTTTPTNVEVLAGLSEGDWVVVDGKDGLTDGQRVEARRR